MITFGPEKAGGNHYCIKNTHNDSNKHKTRMSRFVLPIYTIIDMIETAENVWSDSCVCAMTDHDLSEET